MEVGSWFRYWASLFERMNALQGVPGRCRGPLPHRSAEISPDESRCQAVHSNVLWGKLYGQVLGKAQQGYFTNTVRAQALGKEEKKLISQFPGHSWFLFDIKGSSQWGICCKGGEQETIFSSSRLEFEEARQLFCGKGCGGVILKGDTYFGQLERWKELEWRVGGRWQTKGFLQEMDRRLLWKTQSPLSHLWEEKKKKAVHLPGRNHCLKLCGAPSHPGSLSLMVPSLLHLWHHCLYQQGCSLHVNIQNLKWREGETA